MPHDPFPLQNLDKNRPKSSQNFTPILWLVQITTHFKEQLLQNQGESMVKKGPLESIKDLEGHNRASLTVYSAYLSAYCNDFRVQQLLNLHSLCDCINLDFVNFTLNCIFSSQKHKNVTFWLQKTVNTIFGINFSLFSQNKSIK